MRQIEFPNVERSVATAAKSRH